MSSVIQRLARQKRELWHTQRASLFLRLMRPQPGARVLDLGGNDGEFMARIAGDAALDVTVADIGLDALARARARGFRTAVLDESGRLPFGDNEFDVVFCNSVIEHVTVPKQECMNRRYSEAEWRSVAFASQHRFATEIRRIARSYFVQTPHRGFPVEAHTWLPFVGWLPHQTTVELVKLTDRVWVKKCGYVDWHLLGETEMQSLFPDGRMHIERALGLPKSLIAYRRD